MTPADIRTIPVRRLAIIDECLRERTAGPPAVAKAHHQFYAAHRDPKGWFHDMRSMFPMASALAQDLADTEDDELDAGQYDSPQSFAAAGNQRYVRSDTQRDSEVESGGQDAA